MEDGELAVCRWMDIDLDDVGAERERCFHRGQCVLKEGVFGRIDARGGAGLVVEIFAVIIMMDTAMREHGEFASRAPAHRRVEDSNRARRQNDGAEYDPALSHMC